MDGGNTNGYPDNSPDRELRATLHMISYLKNDIAKLKAKLDETRKLILDDNICIDEKKKVVFVDIHTESVNYSMNRFYIKMLKGG